MDYTLVGLAFIFAAIEWIAVEKKWRSLEYLAKPAVMILLIIWVYQNGGFDNWMIWFILGAVFSLGGDILLLLPKKYFLAGLISFLLAHVAYIIGFNESFPPITAVGVVILFILLFIGWQVYFRLAAGLEAMDLDRLKIPVLIYVIIISLMTLSAIFTLFREDWSVLSALLVSIGAILFYISDALNAWDRFVSHFSHARLLTMISYYLGQAGILIGAVMHFST